MDLSAYGPVGIAFSILFGVVAKQYLDNKALTDRIFDIQEKRRLDNLETAKELSATMSTFTETSQLLIGKIVAVRGEVKE